MAFLFFKSKSLFMRYIILLQILFTIKYVYSQEERTCNITLTLKEKDINGISLKKIFSEDKRIESCWFIVKTMDNYGIRVDYESLLIKKRDCVDENGKPKCCDYLEVGHGSVVSNNLKSTHCESATRLQPDIFQTNSIWFNFHSNDSVIFEEFKIKLTPIKLLFTESSGFISSPESSKNKFQYPNNLNITYKISAEPNNLVYIRFQNYFSLENFNKTCIDYLEIGGVDRVQGANSNQTQMVSYKKYCGEQLPKQLYVYSNEVYLRFVTDDSESSTGFSLFYNTIKYMYTEPFGSIESSDYPINITYMVRAPKNQKIELIMQEFDFPNCNVDLTEKLITSPSKICSETNDYLMFSNGLGDIDHHFQNEISKLPSSGSEWVFCSCNRPVRTYVSLGNELNIKYFLTTNQKLQRYKMNSFKIVYRFVPGEFSSSNRLRIIQDQTTSFIGGYYLSVKVPVDNHLRLFGKSSKCVFPKYSLITKYANPLGTEQRVIKKVNLIEDQFKKDCSYLIDINEPVSANTNGKDWQLIWYLKFENSSQIQDFELNWNFIKNKITDEKKSSIIDLPAQKALDYKEENGLEFYFKTLSKNRKYALSFNLDRIILNNQANSYVMLNLMNDKPDFLVKNSILNDKETSLLLESKNVVLKVKRVDKFSLTITYKLDSQFGDCDFDVSLCNYTTHLDHDWNLGSHKHHEQNNLIITHVPKYSSLNTNDFGVLTKAKDFYISVTKSTENNGSIYSPLLHMQNSLGGFKLGEKTMFNKKIYSLSFSYMMLNHSMNKIDIYIVSNRSDVKIPIMSKSFVAEYKANSNDATVLSLSDDCPSYTMSSILNSFVLNHHSKSTTPATLLPSELSSDILSINQISDQVKNWYRVNGVRLFSCYDFRLGFEFRFDDHLSEENSDEAKSKRTINLNSASPIGLDDIELNYEGSVQECEKNVCGDNGKCYLYNEKSVCCCNPGYEGKHCESKISPCEYAQKSIGEEICKNSGKCIDEMESFDYKCECPKGYSGRNCEKEENECEINPCRNNGKCIDLIGVYECVCKPGYTGKNCEFKTNACKDLCSIGTYECFNDRTETVCICMPDYTGADCSTRIEIDHCASSPCAEGAKCENTKHGFNCLCPDDRSGKYCEKVADFCSEHKHLCKNGSACLFANADGSHIKCSCAAGFTGEFCDLPINDCESKPCVTGKCVDLHLGYECLCPKGIIGRNCDVKPSNPCFQNRCVNGVCKSNASGNYTCVCNHGAEGEFCEREKCNADKHFKEVCHHDGTESVVSDDGECKCLCKLGFSGESCEKKQDLCLIRSKFIDFEDECKNGGKCIFNNQTDEIKCSCPDGYFGDRCELVKNSCKSNPCKYGQCKNEGNTYSCICTKGWEGQNCDKEINRCSMEDCVMENSLEVLYSKQACVCMCKIGFTGDKCQTNINDCEPNPCQNNATCIDLVASFECKCPHKFSGPHCEKKTASCALNPCNNGTCEEIGGKAKCTCDRGFTGEFCETLIDKCSPNPCQNKGVCHNLLDDYFCDCLPEFGTSKNCTERLVDPCKSSPCYNGAICNAIAITSEADKKTVLYTNFTCRCSPGFSGEFCEKTTDLCSSNPCRNRGQCILTKNTNEFTCRCYPAFTGKFCETFFDPCEGTSLCKNGGTCLTTPEGYKCRCPSNYGGENCELIQHPCDYLKCLNGGECAVEKNIPFCKCPNERFIGTRCEIDMSLIQKKGSQGTKIAISDPLTIKCDVLGNETGPINYVFAAIIIFVILIAIITIIYFYVSCSIKKIKKQNHNRSHEKELISELERRFSAE